MHYVINISFEDEKEIKILIEKGVVISIEHFIEVAIRNQLVLEGESINLRTSFPKKPKRRTQKRLKRSTVERKYNLDDYIKRENLSITTVQNISSTGFQNSLLWGQVYRIFPLKFNMRILANILNGKEDYIELIVAKDILSDLAFQIGENMRNIDIKKSKKRSKKLATGFPTDIYGKIARSKERYMNHYVGYLKGRSKVEGSLAQLGFVDIKANEKNGLIGITEMGLKFALAENPILDNQNYKNSLSSKEISQLLFSIKKNLPFEKEHIIHYMSAIESGKNQRETLNEELKEFYSTLPEGVVKWNSPRVINTMRTGITSRLIELGLIDVQYVEQRAIYMVKKSNWREDLN